MNSRPSSTKALARAFGVVFAATTAAAAIAADPPAHIRGTVVSATPESLTVKTSDGTVSVAMDASTRISGVVPSSVDQIKTGTFVGIANAPAAGASNALEVVVFPESMRGAGLGDYPWDLAPEGSQRSAMTNGTVTSSTAGAVATTSSMTNGTVKSTSNAGVLVLTVDYGKGEKTIQVPPGVPVVAAAPADKSKLLPGAHVFVATKKDAPKSAAFISVGIDGTVPPM